MDRMQQKSSQRVTWRTSSKLMEHNFNESRPVKVTLPVSCSGTVWRMPQGFLLHAAGFPQGLTPLHSPKTLCKEHLRREATSHPPVMPDTLALLCLSPPPWSLINSAAVQDGIWGTGFMEWKSKIQLSHTVKLFNFCELAYFFAKWNDYIYLARLLDHIKLWGLYKWYVSNVGIHSRAPRKKPFMVHKGPNVS